MEGSSVDGRSGLEDRLRHLILSNTTNTSTNTDTNQGDSNRGLAPPSDTPGGEQQPQGPQPSPKLPRRRPNQAQRREMAAQLSIPVDTHPEPVVQPGPRHGPAGHMNQQSLEGNRGGYHRKPRDQSAPFRPQQQGGTPATIAGRPSPADQSNWRRPYNQRNGDKFRQPQQRRLYNPDQQHHRPNAPPETLGAQIEMLDKLCAQVQANAEIDNDSLMEKEMFRLGVEQLCREIIFKYEFEQHGLRDFPAETVELKCFGSLASGFATKASDMDLALISPCSPVQPDAPGSPIPRLVERAFLDVGIGARLLTRTRVPIIKVCQNPPEKLRVDLLHERAKWEHGIVDLEDGQDEDQHDEPATFTPTVDQNPAPTPIRTEARSENQEVSEASQESKTYQELLESLQQHGKNLQTYCTMASKVLRKLGGRDLTPVNHANFSLQEYAILKDVVRAFINGLDDENLKARLVGYQSLCQYEQDKSFKHRTLASVFVQVEGEMMAMHYASHLPTENNEALQHAAHVAYIGWLDIQNSSTFGDDPLLYSKELQFHFQRLQGLPSLQLGVLQQQQFESASDYHTRVLNLLVQLGGSDQPGPTNQILPVVVRQYISGIRNNDFRKAVQEFVKTTGSKTLRAVARRHKSLQLAFDFEKALSKGIFSDSDQAVVKDYIDSLRQTMVKMSDTTDEWYDFVVPMDEQLNQAVVPALLHLPNPGDLTQNRSREPYHDKLEFPKNGVGVQCDINFSAHLALHNTALLRCYSLTDPRVQPLVLFVKHWAKVRGINSPYRGSLSSYGYVLMMLHYLINVAQPFVCPNLQQLAPAPDPRLDENEINRGTFCKGANIRFWKDEQAIAALASQNALNRNGESLGQLLRGFFEYYAQSGFMSTIKGRGFHYGRDVISVRTPGGILTKEVKGWTNAKTVIEVKAIAAPPGSASPSADPTKQLQSIIPPPESGTASDVPIILEKKEVRYRYLLAIEDPFELDHNVARTVTHKGIVTIRDEFRRAWRIIQAAGKDEIPEDLFLDAAVAEEQQSRHRLLQLLDEIHGRHRGHRTTA